MGYKNIFIHCGVNNIKDREINGYQKVGQYFDKLEEKINAIKVLCPKSKMHVSPILPTKDAELNSKCIYFNKRLFTLVNQSVGRVLTHKFSVFCDSEGFLSENMGRYRKPLYDTLHLGASGIHELVTIIRKCVYGNINTTVRPYAAVLKGGSDITRSRVTPVSYTHLPSPRD